MPRGVKAVYTLRPCSCGNENVYIFPKPGGKYQVKCDLCGSINKAFSTRQLAAAHWNGEASGDTETMAVAVVPKIQPVNTAVRQDIAKVCDSLETFLAQKNARYGNSALQPVQVFSRVDRGEQLLVRIDDKISRIVNNHEDLRKNDVVDLMGYLALLCIDKGWTEFADLVD